MNRTTRRRAALLLAAALAMATVTATAARGAANAKPPQFKSGGTLTIGLAQGEPDALDPTLARTFSGREVFLTFCEKLYDLDAKANIVPQLASALPTVSKNGLTVTIPLKQGVKFNDGTPFNAKAVVTTLNRDITMKGSVRASELAPVSSVNASGQYKVVIHLKSPYSPLLAQLTDRAGMIMSPKQLASLGDSFATHPVCVGPFMYQNRIAGDSITVVKSPYYYDKQDVHLSKIVFKVENDAAAAAAALKAGDLQALDAVDPTQLPGILADTSLKVKNIGGLGYQGITINIGNKNGIGKPYSTVDTDLAKSAKLRQAFEMAIDRNAMNKVVFGGTVLPGCTAISPSSSWFDKSIKCTTYNQAQAKQLVAQSGIANPTVHLMVPTGTVALRQAQFTQAQEAAVGIKVIIDSTDFVTALNKEDAGTYDAFQIGWSGRVDPDGNIYGFNATPGTLNSSGYSNAKVDQLLNDARIQTDIEKRQADYTSALKILLADRPIVYLYHQVGRAAFSKQIAGLKLYPDTLVRVAFAGYTK
jgi:peptide/nickel transport system substrate-binding protein